MTISKIIFLFILGPAILLSQNANFDKINTLLNNWHHAAAVADEDTFFQMSMANDAIYIGTDASELWTRDEMEQWAKDIFKRDTAWDFKLIERNIYFSKCKKVAWFDELLDTWMGVCRSSGVLEKEKGEWKLKHYHLSIAVPNDLVQDYLKLLSKEEKK